MKTKEKRILFNIILAIELFLFAILKNNYFILVFCGMIERKPLQRIV